MFAIVAIVITVAALALGSAGGGGSGGGSSGGTQNPANPGGGNANPAFVVSAAEANVYRTVEYNSQWGLEAIHAAESYAALAKNNKNIAGDNIKIAITDSGVQENHIDIAGNLSAVDSHNYNANSVNVSDNIGTGTYSASIAAGVKNDNGIHGVAYNANLVIADIYNNAGTSLVANSGIAGVAAIDGVKVINAGWKYGSYTSYNGTPSGTNSTDRDVIAAIQIAKAHDILLVAATGNDADNNNDGGADSAYLSRPKPAKPALFANNNDLSGYVLAVGAVNQAGAISDSSNICGITHDYCLVAPGVAIKGATSDTNTIGGVGINGEKYTTISTSYAAAAEVSGAAAVLRSAWPFLTAPQIANILLSTATDLGAAGVDTIYGHGMLNLYAAVQAQGSNSFSYGNSISQNSYDLRYSSLEVDPIFGDAFIHNLEPALSKAVFFDDYGRDYQANLAQKISINHRPTILAGTSSSALTSNYKTNIIPLAFAQNNSFGKNFVSEIKVQIKSYTDLGKKFSNIDKSVEDKILNAGNGFSLRQNFTKNFQLLFSFNIDDVKNLSFAEVNNAGFISNNGFASSPYQPFISSYAQNNNAVKNFNQFALQQKLFTEKLHLNFSHQTSYQSATIMASQSAMQNQISDFNFNYLPNNKTNLAISFGNLREFNNNFLNSQSLGAFGSSGNAQTSYFKITVMKKLSENFALIANFSQGQTKIAGNDFGIFRNYQNIKSRAASLGFIYENFFKGNIGFLYSEPLRIYSGTANIDIPIARDNAGNVVRYNANISLKPQGKEQDFEIFYSKNVNKNSQIRLNFIGVKDAGNIKSDRSIYFANVNYGMKF